MPKGFLSKPSSTLTCSVTNLKVSILDYDWMGALDTVSEVCGSQSGQCSACGIGARNARSRGIGVSIIPCLLPSPTSGRSASTPNAYIWLRQSWAEVEDWLRMPGLPHTNDGHASSRSGMFYYEAVIFEVEGTLYRVHKHGFINWSQSVFSDMFSLPQVSGEKVTREGDTDENPIRLVGCTKAEFEALLELMNPTDGPGVPALSKEQWIGVLKLGRLWDMPKAAALAIEKLDGFNLSAIEKVRLGKTHGVPSWLKDGYAKMIGGPLDNTTFEDLEMLGFETTSRILWARDQLHRDRQKSPLPNNSIIARGQG
ncbi:hypothetical protein NMY22_g15117 [Coprinellus aureogranulatus]|nr:hypothetical protein NMY22_g15117 [Coprinellus aureogranulatus]